MVRGKSIFPSVGTSSQLSGRKNIPAAGPVKSGVGSVHDDSDVSRC